ncbi:MAG TPA: aminotransferase class I/II-fold pyridoxal phosphate-dependent enzyme, partial [Streptosporangiaceae bacterium]
LLDGFSKTFAMTGWRLGYAALPAALVPAFSRLIINSVSCTSAFSQHAAIAALTGPWEPVDAMVKEFRQRRDVVVEGLNRIPGVSCVEPGGAFYVFPSVKELGLPSKTIEDWLLDQAGVACLSGTSFGRYGEGYLRLSYANSVENLRAALVALGATVAELSSRT